jgi:hypothetical protein
MSRFLHIRRVSIGGSGIYTVSNTQILIAHEGVGTNGITRECYCSQSIRADALKDDSRCNLACQGNTSYICGGYRAFNFYKNEKNEKTKKSLSPKGIRETSVGSVLALGIAVGVLLCIT